MKVTPSSSSKQLPTRLVPAAVSSPSAPAEGWPSASVSTQEPRVRVVSGSTVWLRGARALRAVARRGVAEVGAEDPTR